MSVVYEYGPYRQDPLTRTLSRRGELVAIVPKAFDTLLYLVTNAGKTVSREEIMQAVWPDSFVEEGNLSYNVSQLRKILGEYEPGLPYIQTLPKQGYRFIARVSQVSVKGEESQGSRRLPFGRLRPALVVSLLGLAMITLILALILVRSRLIAPERTARLIRVTSDPGLTMTPALSPDEKFIAYASDRGRQGNMDLWIQQVSGGAAIRLTHDAQDNYSPSFSPDGRTIAFRSEREGGGIYIVSALGGEARKIAPLGRRPRFSPDGKWIAYWIGTDAIGIGSANFPAPGTAKMYIASAVDGASREIRPDFGAAAYPIWTPDSKHLLFLGNRDPKILLEPADRLSPSSDSVDWWVTPIEGGPAVPTGANVVFRGLGLPSVSQSPEAWTEDGRGVLLSAAFADTQNLWRLPISAANWKVSGVPQRLTFGTSMDVQPSIAAGNLTFSSMTGSLDVWSLPLVPDGGKPSPRNPQQLTADAFEHTYPSISADGTKIAYSSRRSGTRDIWVRELATSKETIVSSPPASAFGSAFSPNGGQVAYRTLENQKSALYVVSLADGSRERVSEDCGATAWSSDGKRLLCSAAAPSRIFILDLSSKKGTVLLNHGTWRLWNPRSSPDDRWVSFNATTAGQSRIFVVPFRSGGPVPESEWIAITEGPWDDKPRWSPDGNTLYFMSERDHFRCIWAQRLDSSKHPVGEPVPVFHAHEARRSLMSVNIGALEMSVARNKIVFNMNELKGNLWMMKLNDR
jgi:Tol biopolymer transport system component/DNA-binding winged helix-turn-helix (wHTH) protein